MLEALQPHLRAVLLHLMKSKFFNLNNTKLF